MNGQPSTVNQRGSALIVTLLIVTILTTLAVEFAYEVYIDSSALSNWSNAQKASLMAKSGQNVGSAYLSTISTFTYTYPDKIYLPVEKDFGPQTLLIIQLEDENAKFNINSIIYQNGLTNEEALSSLKKLLEYLKINPSLALTIADWIDPDHEPRLRDSEKNAKNGPLQSMEELQFIGGVEKSIFELVSPYITVFTERASKVNINTAKLPVLISLHHEITETLAQRIIDYRENTPFESTAHVQRVSGMETIGQMLLGKITVKGTNFRITSTARVHEITRIIESIMNTSSTVKFWREV
jgi:type II secretory pathway component PulK